MTTPTPGISDVLDCEDMLRNVIEFAYEHGYHEHGVDLIDEYRKALLKYHKALLAPLSVPGAA